MIVATSKDCSTTVSDFGLIEEKIRGCESAADARLPENKRRSNAFCRLVIETFFDVPGDEADEHIVDGGNDRGIDLIYIDHTNRKINIGTCKVVSKYENSRKNFPGEVVTDLISFIDDLMLKRDALAETANPSLSIKIREIWEIFSGECYDIEVYLFSNQATLSLDPKKRLIEALSRHNIKLLECGLFDLCHGLIIHSKPKFVKTLKILDGKVANEQGNTVRGIECTISLNELARFCSTSNGSFDDRLVWANVRYFLGVENEVNKEIKESLTSDLISEFWYLNSGITIVCDQVLSLANGAHPLKMVNPQIVNGCQTASVVHSVASEMLADLNSGRVRARVIESKNEELVRRIARASNLQSRIGSRDLRANDDFQIQLAEDLRKLGYNYVRKRGDARKLDSLTPLDSARVGQILLAYVCKEPTKSKTNSHEIFGVYYNEAFNSAIVDARLIVSAFKIYAEISKRREKAIAYQKSFSRNTFDELWLIEGHFHVLFVISELMKRNDVDLCDYKKGIEFADQAIEIIDEFVKSANKAAYRIFRLVKSKKEILKLIDKKNFEKNMKKGQIDWITDNF